MNKNSTIKSKTLFDHLNNIYSVQDKDYFNKLSDGDKKSWSNYMINRFISMTYDYIEYIDYIQKYSPSLSPELYYKLLINIFPKKKVFSKYIKSVKDDSFDEEHVNIISKHYEISKKEAKEYMLILNEEQLYDILNLYGIYKEIKSLKKKKKW
jgi:hypothetical protein